MSYNGYNYSPHFRGRDEIGGREQPSYPDVRSINGSYERPIYTALNTEHNGQHQAHYPSQSVDRTSGVYGEQSYGLQGYGSNSLVHPGGGAQNPTVSSQSYGTDAVTSTDTTGLGNLAYASGLGRDSRQAFSQAQNSPQTQYRNTYHTSQPAVGYPSYGTTSGLPNGHDQQRTDSRSSAMSAEDVRRRDSRAGAVSPHIPILNTASGRSMGQVQPYTSPTERNSTSQELHLNSRPENRHQGNTSQSYAFTASLPLNSQRGEPSRTLDKPHSPSVQSQLPPYQHEASQEGYTNGQHYMSTASNVPQPHVKKDEVSSGQHSNRSTAERKPKVQKSDLGGTTIPQHRSVGTSGQTGSPITSKVSDRLAERDTRPNGQHRATSQPQHGVGGEQAALSSASNPTTVDPSQVFNHYEYQRRRQVQAAASAAAEDIIKVNEAQTGTRNTRIRMNGNASQAADQNGPPKTDETRLSAPAFDAPPSHGSNAQREEIEAEMKLMLEKMREYKAKDPSLFSQVWEQVKKGQPSVSTSPQTLPSSSGLNQTSAIASTQEAQTIVDVIDAGDLPIPAVTVTALSSATDAPVADLPDLGKFPAKRHRNRKSRVALQRVLASDDQNETEEVSSVSAGDTSASTKQLPTDGQETAQPDGQSVPNSMQKPLKSLKNLGKPATAPVRPRKQKSGAPAPERIASSTLSSTQSQGTIWPEDNKKALAEAAKSALEARPANAGKSITSDEIHGLLDQNPSYIELCGIIESRGFVLDRGQFARILLSAVPSLNRPSSARVQDRTARPPSGPEPSTSEAQQPIGYPDGPSSNIENPEQARNDPKPSQIYWQPVTMNGLALTQFRANGRHNHEADAPLAITNGAVPTLQVASHSSPAIQSPAPIVGSSSKSVRFTDETKTTPASVIADKRGALKRKQKFNSPTSANSAGNKRRVAQMTFGTGTPHAAIDMLIPPPPQSRPSTPPLTKEDMARKRSFNDIVDLTQDLSDDDNPLERTKRQHDGGGSHISLTNTSASTQQVPAADNTITVPTPTSLTPWDNPDHFRTLLLGDSPNLTSNTTNAQSHPSNAYADISQFEYQPLLPQSQNEHLRTNDVVKPMKRENALRRSSYNAKTLARDILISAGRHPTEKPLNAHLEILQKNFQKVDTTSDLSTFRWDLVDPGNPKREAHQSQSNSDEVEMEDADDEAPRISAPSPTTRRRTRIAVTANGDVAAVPTDVEVLGAVKNMPSRRGRKPCLNAAEIVRSKSGGTQVSQQRTPNLTPRFQTDLAPGLGNGHEDLDLSLVGAGDAGTPAASSPASVRANDRSPLAHRDQISQAILNRPAIGAKKTPKSRSPEGSQSKLRRGRPPGSRNKASAASSSSPVPGSALSRSQLNSTAPTRPSGLRNVAWPVDGIAIVIESPNKPTSKRLLSKTYDCQWKACDAKLHNLETLRTHVHTHCERTQHGAFSCLWADCGTKKAVRLIDSIDDKITLVPFDFSTVNLWEKHVDKRHLDHLAWDAGEGPPSHPSDTEISDYVSSRSRRSVTPIFQTGGASNALPPESILSQSRRHRDRRVGIPRTSPDRMYHQAHHNKSEVAKAKAVLEAVEQRGRIVGLGLERPGAMIVGDEMREALEEEGEEYVEFEDDEKSS